MMEYEEGGLSDQGGTVDPVSGNEVPPGALQEEVRDDIDAKLSEGEFVFPADVVRYIGLEKLMMMRQQAKQGLAMMEKMGQMSNADEAVMEDTAPAEVFDIPDDMDVPAVVVAELEMAEGGDVQGEKRYKSFRELMGTDGDTAEIVTYVNDAGRKIIIMHINGAPVSQVPEGFYPEGSDPPADDDGTDDGDDGSAPPQPPQVPPQRTYEDDPSDPPSGSEPPQGAVVVTGGYYDATNKRIVGGDSWDMSYNLDGTVTLSNPQHGEVTLTKEEREATGIGRGGNFFSNITPTATKELRERTLTLNSGDPDNPALGNEIHKALVEKAQLQKMGKQFVEGNSPKMSLGQTVAAAFGQGSPSEIESEISKILGKTELTDDDYAIIGQALAGTPNQYNLPGGKQADTTKIQQIDAFITGVQGGQFADMSLPKPKPTRDNRGLGGLDMPDITLGKIGDSADDDPPGFKYSLEQPDDTITPPTISPDDGDEDTDPLNTSQPDDLVTTQPGAVFDDDGDDQPTGTSYSIGSGAPVDAFNERPGLGGGGFGGGRPSGGDSFTGSGPGGFFGLNKGALVKKKRKGLASR